MADKLIKMKRMCNLRDNVMFPLVILQLNFTSHHCLQYKVKDFFYIKV